MIPLGCIGTWYGGGTPSKFNDAYWSNGIIPWISPKDMKSLRLSDSEDHISSVALKQTNVKAFPPGTVLVVIRSGILSRTLPIAVADVQATMNQDLKGVFPHDGIDSTYVAHFLRSETHDILRRCSKHGTTVASVDATALHSYPCRVAPTNEQRRIVAKIEELFSDLDAGVAALERAKAKLKRYRAAVLKAAVEGKLTEEWRAQHPSKETASQLLERILKERRSKWEQEQLAAYAKAGKKPPANWKDKYKEPATPDETNLPPLPDGWRWASVAQCASYEEFAITDGPFGSNLKTEHYTDNGPRVIRLQNIGDGVFVEEDAHISLDHFTALQRHGVRHGDVVVAMLGDPRCAATKDNREFELPLPLLDAACNGSLILFAGAGISTENRLAYPVAVKGLPRTHRGSVCGFAGAGLPGPCKTLLTNLSH